MNATRLLPFLLAGMTLVVLFANALPAAQHKHRLQKEERELVEAYREARDRQVHLAAEAHALRHDPFYVERVVAETWCVSPDGAVPLAEPSEDRQTDVTE
ncbi:MAG: hypothetical protein AAGD14_19425 [Planctomycetota bacterium]